VAADEVVIAGRDGRLLRLHSREFGPKGALEYFTAEVRVSTLHAEVRVYAWGADGLSALFEEMALQWRGWEEAKEWSSVEGELKVAARHGRLGHIALEVSLRPLHEEWEAQATIVLEAGSLDPPARSVQEFIGETVEE
jgi:hypothetical protein